MQDARQRLQMQMMFKNWKAPAKMLEQLPPIVEAFLTEVGGGGGAGASMIAADTETLLSEALGLMVAMVISSPQTRLFVPRNGDPFDHTCMKLASNSQKKKIDRTGSKIVATEWPGLLTNKSVDAHAIVYVESSFTGSPFAANAATADRSASHAAPAVDVCELYRQNVGFDALRTLLKSVLPKHTLAALSIVSHAILEMFAECQQVLRWHERHYNQNFKYLQQHHGDPAFIVQYAKIAMGEFVQNLNSDPLNVSKETATTFYTQAVHACWLIVIGDNELVPRYPMIGAIPNTEWMESSQPNHNVTKYVPQ